MKYVRTEHVAGLIVAVVCLLISAWLFSYALRGPWYALSGIGGVVLSLLGWTALRIVMGDLRR